MVYNLKSGILFLTSSFRRHWRLQVSTFLNKVNALFAKFILPAKKKTPHLVEAFALRDV
jgi:hypothetical protein